MVEKTTKEMNGSRLSYRTKPIWQQVLNEIVDTRREVARRPDRLEAIVCETRQDLRDLEDRVERLESKPT
jgi:hypothetical protein